MSNMFFAAIRYFSNVTFLTIRYLRTETFPLPSFQTAYFEQPMLHIGQRHQVMPAMSVEKKYKYEIIRSMHHVVNSNVWTNRLIRSKHFRQIDQSGVSFLCTTCDKCKNWPDNNLGVSPMNHQRTSCPHPKLMQVMISFLIAWPCMALAKVTIV